MIIRDKEGLIKRADVIFTSRYVRMIVRMNTESSKVVVVVTLVRVIANIHPSQRSLYESSMAHQQCTLPRQSCQQLDTEERIVSSFNSLSHAIATAKKYALIFFRDSTHQKYGPLPYDIRDQSKRKGELLG